MTKKSLTRDEIYYLISAGTLYTDYEVMVQPKTCVIQSA
jgi:hypothetical protein